MKFDLSYKCNLFCSTTVYVILLVYAFRSDTPLIYKAVPSWFVRVEHMVEKLLDNNSKCYWYVLF